MQADSIGGKTGEFSIERGAAVGTLVGFGVPWLFHYRHGTPGKGKSSKSERDNGFRVQLAPMGLGVGAMGTF